MIEAKYNLKHRIPALITYKQPGVTHDAPAWLAVKALNAAILRLASEDNHLRVSHLGLSKTGNRAVIQALLEAEPK